jgi:hypothetical protein
VAIVSWLRMKSSISENGGDPKAVESAILALVA